VLRTLELARQHGVVFALGWPFFVPRIQGVAAMLAQRWDEAETHLLQAGSIAEGLRAPAEIARCRLDHARVLAARPDAGDRSAAADLIRRSQADLREHCPKSFRLAAEKLLASLEMH
jgi:hypothetical protein